MPAPSRHDAEAAHGHGHPQSTPHDHGHEHGHGHAPGSVHEHGHGHAHGHAHGSRGGLGASFWLIAVFMVVEAAGGWFSGSLALLADAGHMLVDTLALALAWGAQRLALRPPSSARSFGHARSQVLAAFVNSLLLLAIVAAIIYEAAQRLSTPEPHPIKAPLALAVALAATAVNLFAAWLLHGDEHDLNVRAAYLHVLGDLAGSVAAVVAVLLVMTTGWLPADAWLSLVVAVLIARGAWQLLKHSAHVLQEGTPEGFDAEGLSARLMAVIPAIRDVHHLHAWSLTPRDTLLTLHARLAAGADVAVTLVAVKRILVEEFRIEHSTIQLEPADCADDGRRCASEQPVQPGIAARARP